MMETIRTAANHIVVKIIFAIIILCFIFTGIGFFGFGGSSNSAQDEQRYIAKVDGEGISRVEFEKQAEMVTSKSAGDSTFIKQLRRNVLYHQIDNYLAYKFAKDLKTYISNDLVKDAIRKQKDFFENGKFSNNKYLELLQVNNFTPDSYAEIIRTALQQQQVMNALVNTDFVLPIDSEISSLKNQTRQIYSTLIDPSIVNLDDVNISTEDEQKYYDEHQQDFYRKERVKIKYIVNSKYNLFNTVQVSDNEIKQEFDKNNKDYFFPAKKSFSVISVSDKKQASNIIKQLSSGTSFTEIAESINQNNKISPYGNNGSLGWFTDDDSLPQVFKEANLKKVGQVSKPIVVDNGYLIVKLDNMQKATAMDFDYAEPIIISKLKNKKMEEDFSSIEDKIKSGLNNPSESLEDLANKTGLEIYTSDWSYYNDKFSILSYPEVRDVVFSNEMIADGKTTNKLSEMIPVGNDLSLYEYVVQVIDYHPEGIAPFDEVKDEINKKLSTEIANGRFKTAVDNFLVELNEKGSSDKIQLSKKSILTRTSKEFDAKVVNMVFDIPPSASGKVVYGSEPISDTEAYIVALTKVDTPNDYQDITSELRPLFIKNAYHYLMDDIRARSKIEIMPNSNL